MASTGMMCFTLLLECACIYNAVVNLAAVHQERYTLRRGEAEMVVALLAHLEVVFELAIIEEFTALWALGPDSIRRVAVLAVLRFGRVARILMLLFFVFLILSYGKVTRAAKYVLHACSSLSIVGHVLYHKWVDQF